VPDFPGAAVNRIFLQAASNPNTLVVTVISVAISHENTYLRRPRLMGPYAMQGARLSTRFGPTWSLPLDRRRLFLIIAAVGLTPIALAY